ncbi:MAG: M12 family metallo-peptidase [bacterium]|nr:M12 family metallo-peptidase [bacterium]
MSKRLLVGLAFFIFCVSITTQTYAQVKTNYNLFTPSDNSTFSNSPELKSAVANATILDINREELRSLSENKNPEITIDIPYMNSTARLELKRFDILTPNAKIVSRTAAGNVEVTLDDVAFSYNGKVQGMENTMVSITFTKNNVTGLMVTGNDNYVLGALNDNRGVETGQFVLYRESDLKAKNSFNCATEDNMSSEYLSDMRNIIMQSMNNDSPTDLYVAEIALELDFATYNIYGASIQNTTNYALALMAASSAIYMKEVNVRFVIPYVRVWTSPDPYTGGNSNALLNQFRAEWNANQQSVQRALAHFITRRGGGLGGIAWVNALCSSLSGGIGYGLSGTDGPILPLPTYSWDVMVVSHEIGHNFGSNHTHNCGWVDGPIDSCYAVEGGCYNGPAIARVGTIMSYCHLNGSISLTKGFGTQPRAVLRNAAESVSCMYISDRTLYMGYPNGGETFRTGLSTQIYWGTSLTGNINIELSTNNGSSWQTIQNNVAATDRIYDWILPVISSTAQAKVRVISSANPSVGDTTDASFKILLSYLPYNLVSPPTLSRLEVAFNSTQSQKFVWSRAGTDPSLKYKVKFRKIGATTDYIYNADNSGNDSVASLRKSLLDSLALTLGTTGDSVRCSWRVWSYNGFDSAASASSFLITLIRTTVGINVISSTVPDKFSLGNNYPNPFNPETNIKFDVAKSTFVELAIYDSRGREINRLVNEILSPGSYEYSFNAGNLPSGVYFYRIKTSDFSDTKRMMLIK